MNGFLSKETSFRSNVRWDIALVNKAFDILVEDLRIPQCWYQLEHKGLVCHHHRKGVKPKREPLSFLSYLCLHCFSVSNAIVTTRC